MRLGRPRRPPGPQLRLHVLGLSHTAPPPRLTAGAAHGLPRAAAPCRRPRRPSPARPGRPGPVGPSPATHWQPGGTRGASSSARHCRGARSEPELGTPEAAKGFRVTGLVSESRVRATGLPSHGSGFRVTSPSHKASESRACPDSATAPTRGRPQPESTADPAPGRVRVWWRRRRLPGPAAGVTTAGPGNRTDGFGACCRRTDSSCWGLLSVTVTGACCRWSLLPAYRSLRPRPSHHAGGGRAGADGRHRAEVGSGAVRA